MFRAPKCNLYSVRFRSIGMGMGEQRIRSFKEISEYKLSEEGSYYVLRLVTKKGGAILYGVPDSITRDNIEVVLVQCGLNKVSPQVKLDFAVKRN